MKPQRTRIAAYALIRDDIDRVLLCRLSKQVPQWVGFWTLPGGGIEFGEHPEAAMVREVREETGFIVESTGLAGVDSLRRTVDDHEFHSIRILYHARIVGGALTHEAAGSTDRCEWHALPIDSSVPLVDLAKLGVQLVGRGSSPLHAG